MIRYDCSRAQLHAAVDAVDINWRSRARERTNRFIAHGRFDDQSPIWSDIKAVYIHLQHQKCAFCERQFETIEYGRIEYDLEHFRPKSSVKPWPPRGWRTNYDFPTGVALATGYYWLAYELRNYAVSCKVCNSILKKNYFPVAASRVGVVKPLSVLSSEKPYLCYPLGRSDADPETLISFDVTTAIPQGRSGHKRRRGELIIDFFQLNEREQLHRERARMISVMGAAMISIASDVEVQENEKLVQSMLQSHMPHAACLRAHRRLWDEDVPRARRAAAACLAYAISSDAPTPPEA